MESQWKELVVEPLKTILDDSSARTKIIVLIDGLDECENEHDQIDVLNLLNEAEIENIPLRIIVSSRPECHIHDSFLRDKAVKCELHRSARVDDDIRLFLRDKFRGIINQRKFRPSIRSAQGTWPSDEDINILVTQASGQYIYAVTALKYVEMGKETTPVIRLKQILDFENTHELFSDLDLLYQASFRSVLPRSHSGFLGFFLFFCGKSEEYCYQPYPSSTSFSSWLLASLRRHWKHCIHWYIFLIWDCYLPGTLQSLTFTMHLWKTF
ncbi:hypothetical protein BDQ17DRAFT_1512530 [Cyathus striatus]|nr:hypothetical protein BDQ17DRAFT_1512530 [Cyathus striatus]